MMTYRELMEAQLQEREGERQRHLHAMIDLDRRHRLERHWAINSALKDSGGNKLQAAEALGCVARTVHRHVKKHGLPE